MVNKSSVRNENLVVFRKCVSLRKKGYSYSEIRQAVPVAKSTLHGWLTLAGLTLSEDHVRIQFRKRRENWINTGVEASRMTRQRKSLEEVNRFLELTRGHFNDPLFLLGVMAYEAEGSKSSGSCKFSNSDLRLIKLFVKFMKKYFRLNEKDNFNYRLYVHESFAGKIEKIMKYWSDNLGVDVRRIALRWKRSMKVRKKKDGDYVGQMVVSVVRSKLVPRKMAAVSDIIIGRYCGVV